MIPVDRVTEMKILAADDEPIILDSLSPFLEAVGPHDLTAVASGQDAINLLARPDAPHFDCFLLDIQMPGIDGMALARHIRQQPLYATAPIVMLTAMSEKRYIDRAFCAGATDYVTKPFDLTELRGHIDMAEQRVLSCGPDTSRVYATSSLLELSTQTDHVNLHAPSALHDIDNVIGCTVMDN
jgi:CheY-like chemotaxis protein